MDAAGTLNTAPSVFKPILRKLAVILFWYRRCGVSGPVKSAADASVPDKSGKLFIATRVPVSFTYARFGRPARKRLARQFLVEQTESCLPGRGADFEQVLVSKASR